MKHIKEYTIKGTFRSYVNAEDEEQAEELFYQAANDFMDYINVEEVVDENQM